ncbi:MAG TPA: dipeptidase PepE [Candidatus Limnocylindrales bacterium]|nr:dipeptidase PepE [Candidatus Limnocylindrales bacterium]
MRILLLSNSGRPFLEHAKHHLADFLAGVRRLAFVTAASLTDEVAYWQRAQDSLSPDPGAGLGLDVLHLRWDVDPLATLARAQAIFVGGGNTYALLKRLRHAGLLDAIRARVEAGMPYVGASAGSNVAGPRILTTNDWNVVALEAFDALGLVDFNINPHYQETDPTMAPGSETRDDRIREYHAVWDNPVVGIEEGTALRIEDGVAAVLGRGRVKLFERGREPRWLAAGERLPLSPREEAAQPSPSVCSRVIEP